MYLNKRILAVITARGGSKGVPGKNIKLLAGKPLIAWTIEAAHKSKLIDRTVLSSEDEAIIETAQDWGCEVPFVRPLELAADDSSSISVVLHALNQVEGFDYIVLLQPTSPLRRPTDIDAAIRMCIQSGVPSLVSVTESDKHPLWMFDVNPETGVMKRLIAGEMVTRRQDLLPAYVINGAIYIADCEWLKKNQTFTAPETIAYKMPKESSLDIDTELDFKLCNYLLTNKENI